MKYTVSNIEGTCDTMEIAVIAWESAVKPCGIDEKVWVSTLGEQDAYGYRETINTLVIAKGRLA